MATISGWSVGLPLHATSCTLQRGFILEEIVHPPSILLGHLLCTAEHLALEGAKIDIIWFPLLRSSSEDTTDTKKNTAQGEKVYGISLLYEETPKYFHPGRG